MSNPAPIYTTESANRILRWVGRELMFAPEETAEHRRQWTDALRSGNYTQTFNSLRDKDGFSALGVACLLSGLGEWQRPIDRAGTRPYIIQYPATSDEAQIALVSLPSDVRRRLGLRNHLGLFRSTNGETATLMLLNNNHRLPFEAIADIIESEPEEFLIDYDEMHGAREHVRLHTVETVIQ